MVALTTEQYKNIIEVMNQGFKSEDKEFRGNNRIATILVIQANLGLRIGDILSLRLNDIIKDGDRYRLNIIEDKTDKKRTFTVPQEIYNYIKMYTLENSIKSTSKIFDITVRAVQKQLKLVTQYLELQNISTHSFRKYFATQIYINNNYNVALVKELLQHSDLKTTQKYINIGTETIEKALNNHIQLL
ncbi:tyrosine-type recombinase/integrase [Clostridium sp. CF011]|uniref:tyrosine-type recombinase/integrase n=1 Tax=Clostridium sp. CF011 TaxID=2843318 RepID=UPI001C0D11F0|nr:tyrosine-type recombinase/integrase [Clostridium sp. CF011]MBU3093819.1 tyrosine-type recombinase/integrase [Clostridium sp. CF011]WAG71751.1 tyrosine-type recombinase/integrase [Clostridium sp. CF011]